MSRNNSYDLSGKTALVTGASRGIGAAIANALGDAGATVVAHYGSDHEGAQENLKGVPEERKVFIGSDLSVPGSARELWEDAISAVGKIDILVNNAAVNIETPLEGSHEQWDSGWEATMQVNVLEPASLVREAVAHFVPNGGGVLISMSSWSGQKGSSLPSLSAYAASKAAIKSFTQTIATSYAKEGVLAYIIAPGIVKTRMSDLAAVIRGGEEKMKSSLVLGELVTPDELGNLAVFLASGKCRHLTGATLDVNGASYIR
jgi:NAD(P)-dependent dehydrogenase (short-subunit alcohol dehydrogenase family)